MVYKKKTIIIIILFLLYQKWWMKLNIVKQQDDCTDCNGKFDAGDNISVYFLYILYNPQTAGIEVDKALRCRQGS